jgi:type VI secretion system protein ImpF
MAKREIERTVQPSLLDRLTDDAPKSTVDPRVTYAESLREFKGSVQRDLEWLLNTRRVPIQLSDDLEELQRSVYAFGIPDITSMSRDSQESRLRLLQRVEDALTTFEPRLENVKVSMVEVDGQNEHSRRELRFVVEATLRLDPTPEQVVFDTVLNFSSGQIDVAGGSDA